MELANQIKKYRAIMNLSQEELAQKIYVTRQTISNWENNKSYPDIHSLLLLSSVFNISLDQLIKGDVKIMQKEINKEELRKFNYNGVIFTLLLAVLVVSGVPVIVFLGYYGWIIFGILSVVTMYFAIKIERYKKDNNIQTYKEIMAFMEGKPLDEIEKAKEYGKRPYQKILSALISAMIGFLVAVISVWILKRFNF
ncbi:MAG: helix-turn-helix transcriptional regulator [Lachnospiraceae bacterium]|nr:helix-turn-helix transcriptional regulator [Lachnospiraceae bacterium]